MKPWLNYKSYCVIVSIDNMGVYHRLRYNGLVSRWQAGYWDIAINNLLHMPTSPSLYKVHLVY